MIVNMNEAGWEIIYHRAHALLAAQIAGQWPKDKTPRVYETIAAISQHDDLEREWQGHHLTEAGAPKDFQLETDVSIDELTQLVEDARYRSRWVAMLTSMHVCFLNEGRVADYPELEGFLEKQRQLQQGWRETLDISQEEANQSYEFMRWCDRLSLILAQRQVPIGGRGLEITSGIEQQRYDIKQNNNGTLTVTPWPFERGRFDLTVEAQYLSTLQYDSYDDLQRALREDAKVKDVTWTFVK